MERFAAGDKVIAINTDMSRAMHPAENSTAAEYWFPDGVLSSDVVYHVAAVREMSHGQGVFITGLRVYWLNSLIPWSSCRFRKVGSLKEHVAKKKSRKQPRVEKMPAKRRVVAAPMGALSVNPHKKSGS